MLNQVIKQKLAEMLLERVLDGISQKRHIIDKDCYLILEDPIENWHHKHFDLMDVQTGISNSSLKRLFHPQKYPEHENFNQRTKKKFCAILGFKSWAELINHIFGKSSK